MNTILWEVDAQADFMLAGGKLYVPGAEKIILNLNRLVECARQDRVVLISSADAHSPDDPEFREWPPHCVKGTAGAELIPEARAGSQMVIPNEQNFAFPGDLSAYQQILLEKNTLDVFDNQAKTAVWHGYASGALSDEPSENAEKADQAVRKIVDQYPA